MTISFVTQFFLFFHFYTKVSNAKFQWNRIETSTQRHWAARKNRERTAPCSNVSASAKPERDNSSDNKSYANEANVSRRVDAKAFLECRNDIVLTYGSSSKAFAAGYTTTDVCGPRITYCRRNVLHTPARLLRQAGEDAEESSVARVSRPDRVTICHKRA